MFPKSKYSKSNQGSLNYKQNIGASLQSSKYSPNIYTKKKSTLSKKMSNKKFSNHTWKKQNSHNNWNKENDKNNLNYEQYNKNDNNKYYNIYKEKKENKSYYSNKKYLYSYDNKENSYKPKNFHKNEKKISIDYTTTQSNSSSLEESINNNQINSNDNNNNITIPNENYNSNDSLKINIEEEIKNSQKNINNNVTDFKNLNLNSNSLIIENINFIVQSNTINNNIQINDSNNKIPEPSNQIISLQQQKKNKKLKNNKNLSLSSKKLNIKKCISANIDSNFHLNNEPYNKFNSFNNDLLTTLINPIIENTEILQVNVKIAKDKNVVFKLRRFDDLFLTVKLFCEINSIEEKLIKPIITKALCALNSIYQIYNSKLDSQNIKILKMINHLNNEICIDY